MLTKLSIEPLLRNESTIVTDVGLINYRREEGNGMQNLRGGGEMGVQRRDECISILLSDKY